MKNVQLLLFITGIMLFTTCSNSNNKTKNTNKLTEFLSGFTTLSLPLSSSDLKRGEMIEFEFLDILTDTTGKFSSDYPDEKIHFATEYVYTGKIQPENQSFKILIIGQRSSSYYLGDGGDSSFVNMLYTIDSLGKIIASIPFSKDTATIEKEELYNKWYMNGLLNKNFELQTKAYTLQRDGENIDDEAFTDTTISIINYRIETDGMITKVSETSEKKENTASKFKNFIKYSYKPNIFPYTPVISNDLGKMNTEQLRYVKKAFDLRLNLPEVDENSYLQPIIVESVDYLVLLFLYGNTEKNEAYLSVTNKNGKIISEAQYLYRNDYDRETIYKGNCNISALGQNRVQINCIQEEYNKNDENNKSKQELTNYVIDETGKIIQITKGNLKEGTITATFSGFKQKAGIMYYFFITETGEEYYFNQLPKNTEYTLVYMDADNPEGFENYDLLGKTFNIDFHSDKSDGGEGGEIIDFYYINKIKMLSK